MSDQREYREWRSKIEAEHGWAGVTFSMMEKSGKVVGAEAWRSTEYLGSWPTSKTKPSQGEGK